jgi:flagellar motor component MotA
MAEPIRKTAYGPVNATALERLQDSFETHRLLDAIDQMDRLAELIGNSSFRKDLLRLHNMANTIINDAPKTISSGKERIWELAGSLAMELEETVEDLSATVELLNQLAELSPESAAEDADEGDA